jgi:hypothetical protein
MPESFSAYKFFFTISRPLVMQRTPGLKVIWKSLTQFQRNHFYEMSNTGIIARYSFLYDCFIAVSAQP